jgi:hypothetical protein
MWQRLTLLAALVLLGSIAVAAGSAGILLGPVLGPDTAPVGPDVDSEYRFLSAIWLSWGLALWWSSRRLHARVAVTRVLLLAAVAGGLARLVSALVVGWPNPVLRAALAVELLVVPAVVLWHAHAVRESTRPSPAGPTP